MPALLGLPPCEKPVPHSFFSETSNAKCITDDAVPELKGHLPYINTTLEAKARHTAPLEVPVSLILASLVLIGSQNPYDDTLSPQKAEQQNISRIKSSGAASGIMEGGCTRKDEGATWHRKRFLRVMPEKNHFWFHKEPFKPGFFK
ncbi:hypothetical protein EYF80_038500 [Liparis tanakae]|uniref:Uncharacterized protein n=1 Tax=Liparis tanakae TaxID=230148 RepID=A0A4Z2GF41_9TELE|nr:hypothetical protein EYF80_038500 [Liparis tanakae]